MINILKSLKNMKTLKTITHINTHLKKPFKHITTLNMPLTHDK